MKWRVRLNVLYLYAPKPMALASSPRSHTDSGNIDMDLVVAHSVLAYMHQGSRSAAIIIHKVLYMI